jgi:hypothetical protein
MIKEIEDLKIKFKALQANIDEYCGCPDCVCFNCKSKNMTLTRMARKLGTNCYQMYDKVMCKDCGAHHTNELQTINHGTTGIQAGDKK